MAADSSSPLAAVAIVELDTNKDVMLAWCYPSLVPVETEKAIVAQAEPILAQRSLVGADAKRTQYFTRFGGQWLYGCVAFPVLRWRVTDVLLSVMPKSTRMSFGTIVSALCPQMCPGCWT